MSQTKQRFKQKNALIAYLTVGDGGRERTLEAALALLAGGVTMLELGLPFSDPIADGPVIQQAMVRALKAGTGLEDMCWLAQQIRQYSAVPLVFFSYLNPLLQADVKLTLTKIKQAGFDALLVVDCPFEESAELRAHCRALDLAWVGLISPTTPANRIRMIAQAAQGFLYYVCRSGTTGVHETLPEGLVVQLEMIKAQTELPVVVGFGISRCDQITAIHTCAEGAVVGSFFVQAVAEGKNAAELTALTATLVPKRGDNHDTHA